MPDPHIDARARFITRLQQSLADGSFIKLQLGRPQGGDATLDKLLARRVLLRGEQQLSLVWRHRTKDITKNLPLDQAVALIGSLLADPFHHAHLVTRTHDIQLAPDKKGRWALRVGRLGAEGMPGGATAGSVGVMGSPGSYLWPDEGATQLGSSRQRGAPHDHAPGAAAVAGHGLEVASAGGNSDAMETAVAPAGAVDSAETSGAYRVYGAVDAQPVGHMDGLAHDRARRHALTLTTPFLAELGVTDAQHRLVPAMARKWRQINKFAEVLAHAIDRSPLARTSPVRVLDFGAGKGYLTFAVHHLLQQRGQQPQVVGVDLREDLCSLCNQAASRLALSGLRFEAGDVASHAPGPVDIMIALHACDTATDVAMHRGITSGAAIILCSPCCHKQLRPQMKAPPLLQPMLRHGIHMAEQAEMLTDTLRALLLQSAGYDTQVFEFVSPEHTSKNKMVLAVRRAQPLPKAPRQALCQQVSDLKAFYGVQTQHLESLLTGAPTADQRAATCNCPG